MISTCVINDFERFQCRQPSIVVNSCYKIDLKQGNSSRKRKEGFLRKQVVFLTFEVNTFSECSGAWSDILQQQDSVRYCAHNRCFEYFRPNQTLSFLQVYSSLSALPASQYVLELFLHLRESKIWQCDSEEIHA